MIDPRHHRTKGFRRSGTNRKVNALKTRFVRPSLKRMQVTNISPLCDPKERKAKEKVSRSRSTRFETKIPFRLRFQSINYQLIYNKFSTSFLDELEQYIEEQVSERKEECTKELLHLFQNNPNLFLYDYHYTCVSNITLCERGLSKTVSGCSSSPWRDVIESSHVLRELRLDPAKLDRSASYIESRRSLRNVRLLTCGIFLLTLENS